MRYDQLDTVRRALFGFQHGTSNYPGWFDALFEDYTLHPYFNVLRPETQDLLAKKTLFGRLVPIFAKRLRITSIINTLLGIDIIHNKQRGPSIAEELAQVLLEEAEARKTINDRIKKIEVTLKKSSRYFSGLTHHIHGKEKVSTLSEKNRDLTGALVAVEGVLNHVNAISGFDPKISQALLGSGVEWILSDVPFFAMTPQSKHHSGTFLGLRIDEEIHPLLSEGIPFVASIGWFPYVIAFGSFRESISPRHPGKAIDLAWVKLRKPKFPDLNTDDLLEAVFHDKSFPSFVPQPSLIRAFEPDNLQDLFLFLSCIQIVHQGNNIVFENASEGTRVLATEALRELEHVPENLVSFYGSVINSQ